MVSFTSFLNPGTGYPENNSLASVSVLSKSSTEADGLTTATFLLGLEKGMLLVESLDGVEAIMVTKDKKIYLSSGIKSGKIPFRLANDEFTVAE